MKNILIFLILITVTAVVKSQYLDRQIVASAGGYIPTEELSVSFTIGDIVVSTIQFGGIDLSQGFQQGELFLPTPVNSMVQIGFEVYPNPAEDWLRLTFEEKGEYESNHYTIRMYSISGQVIYAECIFEDDGSILLDLGGLIPGTYLICIEGTGGRIGNVPFVKL